MRIIDTHAGAGGYSLESRYAQQGAEFEAGIARLWGRDDLPPALADYVGLVRQFNSGGKLQQYPGSPALAQLLLRPQDQLRLFEMHPTDHKILASYLGGQPGIEVAMGDGFAALKAQLPPPTRRGVVLIDPSYEIKTDYARVLAALREALTRFPEAVVMIWLPQVRILEAQTLPQRLKATADAQAKKGWLLATLTVGTTDEKGFGMFGSQVFVANPPHTLREALAAGTALAGRAPGHAGRCIAQTGSARRLKPPGPRPRGPVIERLVDAARAVGLELRAEGLEAAGVQRLAHLAHQVQVVVQVVDAGQHRPQHLAAAVQVVQVGAAEAGCRCGSCRSGRAAARRLRCGVADLQVAEAREQVAVARVARGHHAVEHVHALRHAFDQVFRRAHAHQVARLVRRQPVRRVRHDAQHLVLGLADADAADRVAGQVQRGQRVQRFLAQVLEHAALHDAEQRVRVLEPREFVLRSAAPSAGSAPSTARASASVVMWPLVS